MSFFKSIKNIFSDYEMTQMERKQFKREHHKEYHEMETHFIGNFKKSGRHMCEKKYMKMGRAIQNKEHELLTSFHSLEKLQTSYPSFVQNNKWKRSQVVVEQLKTLAKEVKNQGKRDALLKALISQNSVDTVNKFILRNLMLGLKSSAPKMRKSIAKKNTEKLKQSRRRKTDMKTSKETSKVAPKGKKGKERRKTVDLFQTIAKQATKKVLGKRKARRNVRKSKNQRMTRSQATKH